LRSDVAAVCKHAFEKSSACPATRDSTLSLRDVDALLESFTSATTDANQSAAWSHVLVRFKTHAAGSLPPRETGEISAVACVLQRRCTADELFWFIRLVKKDLKVNAGTSTVLKVMPLPLVAGRSFPQAGCLRTRRAFLSTWQGLHPLAKDAFRHTNDLPAVVVRFYGRASDEACDAPASQSSGLAFWLRAVSNRVFVLSNTHACVYMCTCVRLPVMTPIKPMLAEAVKSFEVRLTVCANGVSPCSPAVWLRGCVCPGRDEEVPQRRARRNQVRRRAYSGPQERRGL
jgi:hypothetical protein